MLDFPTWKKLWLWGLTFAATLLALPSLVNVAGLAWPVTLPNPQVNLGLDLAGGGRTFCLRRGPRTCARNGSRTWRRTCAS